ncbi:MAG: DUF1592 domain-containing protein [Verrucomicrobiota bacterium]
MNCQAKSQKQRAVNVSSMGSHVMTLLAITVFVPALQAAELPAAAHFRKDIEPLLTKYCADCHADGEKKGEVSFDTFKSDSDLVGDHDLWLKVVKNLHAGLMPPAKKTVRPTAEEMRKIGAWVKYDSFGLDPKNPDPGRVTVRRLNRVEYRNTIRDLMGVDFNTDVEFPPDDSGYGFDNIGDVLTLSPMLLEKYLAAAKVVVTEAVPAVGKVMPERTIAGGHFRGGESPQDQGRGNQNQLGGAKGFSYYDPTNVFTIFSADHDGTYRLTMTLAPKGNFNFDPGRCKVVFKVDDREVFAKEFGWDEGKAQPFDFEQKWTKGEHRLTFELQPLTPKEKYVNGIEMRIVSVAVRGPMDQKYWSTPRNYERFFPKPVPARLAARRTYARQLLADFTQKAFRRPVDEKHIARLEKLAESVFTQPGKSFEAGIAHAMIAVLASPQFLFRLEEPEKGSAGKMYANVDEYSLASRLSYFLWSTMPDEELFQLAEHRELRKNLAAQVKRMLADPRSEQMVQNFTGQWLQTRDVEAMTINANVVLARDSGTEDELASQRRRFQNQFLNRPFNNATNRLGATNLVAQINGTNAPALALTNAPGRGNFAGRGRDNLNNFNRRRERDKPTVQLDKELKQAMQKETEMFVSNVVHEDRPVTELIESDYTYLNEKLAFAYALTNLDITGTEMRKVTLPPDSPRGGVLTDGSVLVVTSNPDRTSPVKRGLFVLSNFMGTPAPPPPANVPALSAAENDIKDHKPTLREALALHREAPLCASCHNRMDPIGLGMENFNALGMYREKERNQVIETPGKLITGESFNGVRELKHILATSHKMDFYRCLSEKLLTYSLGRGLEYYDLETVDQIVNRLDEADGRFSALLTGIIESAPFQKQRNKATPVAEAPRQPQKASPSKAVAQNQSQP